MELFKLNDSLTFSASCGFNCGERYFCAEPPGETLSRTKRKLINKNKITNEEIIRLKSNFSMVLFMFSIAYFPFPAMMDKPEWINV